MDQSVLIARITAVVYLSAFSGMVFSGDYYRRIPYDAYKNAGLTYMMGFIAVVAGCLIVHYHNTWQRDWTILITIMGWLSLIKGVLIIVFPKFIYYLFNLLLSVRILKIMPYLTLVLGLLFGYFGFLHGGD
jgi:hypothetical protein